MIEIGIAKYPINFEFFNKDSEEYWYFLGLVSSDGYVSDSNIEICLNKKDATQHLFVLYKLLYDTNHNHYVYVFYLHNKQIF